GLLELPRRGRTTTTGGCGLLSLSPASLKRGLSGQPLRGGSARPRLREYDQLHPCLRAAPEAYSSTDYFPKHLHREAARRLLCTPGQGKATAYMAVVEPIVLSLARWAPPIYRETQAAPVMNRWLLTGLIMGLGIGLAVSCNGVKAEKGNDTFTSPEQAGPDFVIQGEYVGEITGKGKLGAQLIAEGDGVFVVRFLSGGLPGEGWDGKSKVTASARTMDGKTTVQGDGGAGEIANGKLTGTTRDGEGFTLSRLVRESPTLGMKP